VQLAGIPVPGDPEPPEDGALAAPKSISAMTTTLAKRPPPPPPPPSSKIKESLHSLSLASSLRSVTNNAPTIGTPEFLEFIKGARGILKSTEGEHKAQKPKDNQDKNRDIATALAHRFASIQGIGMDDPETLDDWDGDWEGSGATDAEWGDDGDDILR